MRPIAVQPSDFVGRLLPRLAGRLLLLHSRFERSANFLAGPRLLLTVTGPSLGRSPFGLASGQELGQALRLIDQAGGIRLDGGVFRAGGTPVLTLAPLPPYGTTLAADSPRPQIRATAFRRLLSRVTNGPGLAEVLAGNWPDLPAGGTGCSPWIRQAAPSMAVFARGPAAGLDDAARQLVGLGPGLTPSGDDFLLGYIAARTARGCYEEVRALRRRLSRHCMQATSLIAASYLRHGFRGRFSSHLKHLLETLHRPGVTEAALLPVMEAVARIGSTSGQDVLMGVLAALYREA